MRRVLAFPALAVAALAFSGCSDTGPQSGASPAAWPKRPIQISCFASAGGGTDLVDRTIAKAMEKHLGTRIDVINRTGGRGGIAMHYVWSRDHNGYQWGGFSESVLTAPVMGGHETTAKDWTYFMVAGAPGVISVRADSQFKSLEALVQAARASPGRLRASASSAGGIWHTKLVALENAAGIKFNFISYNGSNPSQLAVLSGEVDVVLTSISEQAELILAKKLAALAMAEADPYELTGAGLIPAAAASYPDVAKLPLKQWLGFALPIDTPRGVLEKITGAFAEAMRSEEIKNLAQTQHLDLYGYHGEQANRLARQMEKVWSWALHELNIAKKSPAEFGIEKP